MNKQVLQDLMQNIEARKQTEQRLKATMGVLLARSENQILVLETLLKRLVQVCVHTQDKRLAKELKLMDFTRLPHQFGALIQAKKIGDEHTQMRQMLIHEDGILGPSPAESFLMDPMNSGAAGNPMNIPNGPRLDDAQMSAGASAVNLSQYRGSSQSAATQHAVMQHQMMQQQKQPSAGPQGPHMPHMQHSQQPPLSQAPGGQGPLRRDSAALSQPRDASLQLRNLWTQDGPSIDNPGMSGMPGNVPQMQGMQGPTANSLLMGGGAGSGGRMHMNSMMRSGSAANSQMTGPGSGGSAGQHLRGFDNGDQPFGSFA